MPSDPHAATLEAFYARVMRRVCEAYRDESESEDREAIERLEQTWRLKLRRYTGSKPQCEVEANTEIAVIGTSSPSHESSSDDDSLSISSFSNANSASTAAGRPAIGRPSAKVPRAAVAKPSSVFAKMLGGKRKLHQLDGTASDDASLGEDTEEANDEDVGSPMSDTLLAMIDNANYGHEGTNVEEKDPRSDDLNDLSGITTGEKPRDEHGAEEKEGDTGSDEAAPMRATSATSTPVSVRDLVPVSGLYGSEFPLQVAAEYSKFRHRGKRRGYFGELEGIVLTWPSRLGPTDTVQPGDLVWCYANPEEGLNCGLVEVVSLGSAPGELKLKLPDGDETTLPIDRVHRLREYLIRKGTLRLQSEQ